MSKPSIEFHYTRYCWRTSSTTYGIAKYNINRLQAYRKPLSVQWTIARRQLLSIQYGPISFETCFNGWEEGEKIKKKGIKERRLLRLWFGFQVYIYPKLDNGGCDVQSFDKIYTSRA